MSGQWKKRQGITLLPSAFRHLLSALLPLALCLALTACHDQQARQQNADLTRRVAALEAEVKALKAAQANAINAPTVLEVGSATTRAAAQNCAFDLARNLEDYHQSSLQNRYPTRTELTLPDSCTDQYVKWEKLTASAYAFSVQNAAGEEMARQSGP